MQTKTQAEQLAKQLGAEISIDTGRFTLIWADAPPGQRWMCAGVHAIAASFDVGEESEAWEDLFERMEFGIEACPKGGDENCRTCDCPAWEGN